MNYLMNEDPPNEEKERMLQSYRAKLIFNTLHKNQKQTHTTSSTLSDSRKLVCHSIFSHGQLGLQEFREVAKSEKF